MGLPYTGSLMLKPYADRYGMDVYQVRRTTLKWRCFIGVNIIKLICFDSSIFSSWNYSR